MAGRDWRVSTRLTLNAGLPYDLELPRTERYNRMNFLQGVAEPLRAAAIQRAADDVRAQAASAASACDKGAPDHHAARGRILANPSVESSYLTVNN